MASEGIYNRVTEEVIHRLINIVGEKNVFYDNLEKMEPYSHDETPGNEYAGMPEVVIKVSSSKEISEIMKIANQEAIPVTPRGGGSGVSGGAVPLFGGIVISLEKMNKIIEIDKENLVAVVEPGVITNDFSSAVQREGLFFAGYPMSKENCFIGGNVGENAGGGRALKYGVTGRYILGLETVLPNGDIAFWGGKRLKDVTGYNMVQLMVGSEGTLGIFTKIVIRLLPLPKEKVVMLVVFDSLEKAINVVPKIMNSLSILPTSIEFMDRLSIDISQQYLGEREKFPEAKALLLIEVDGNDEEVVRNECLDIGDFCIQNGALDAFVAEGPVEQEKMWKVRSCVGEALFAAYPTQSVEDIVVPINNIAKMVFTIKEIAEKYEVFVPCLGHAGDGNIHAIICKTPGYDIEEWKLIQADILNELYSSVKSLGGTISGEHGIGHKRKQYMPLVLEKPEIDAMKSVKKALDPNNILNPGKIFE